MAKQKQAESAVKLNDIPGDCTSMAQPPDASSVRDAAAAALGQPVDIVHGANDTRENISGQTVAQARKMFTSSFNIPADAKTFVNGNQVTNEEETVLQAGDQLEFIKEAGQKG